MNNQQDIMAQPSTKPFPQADTTAFNDRDRINDLLAMEKWICSGYNTACNEASHRALFDDWKRILNDHHDCQHRLFEIMFNKGWYKLKAADLEEVSQVHQNFNNYRSQIPQTW